jgi:hypothetical protein
MQLIVRTVTEWSASNPHCLLEFDALEFDAKDDPGTVVQGWKADVQPLPGMASKR